MTPGCIARGGAWNGRRTTRWRRPRSLLARTGGQPPNAEILCGEARNRPHAVNPLGVTALHCAVRQGFNSIVKYLVAKATERVGDGDELKAWLDLKTLGVLKLAPIDGAAVRGHPSTIAPRVARCGHP